MMENWLALIDREGVGLVSGVWRERIAKEIDSHRESRRYFIWAGGVPEPVSQSLEAFRPRLEAAYRPLANPLELLRDSNE